MYQEKELQRVYLSTYFKIKPSKQSDRMNLESSTIDDKNAMPFLGRSSINNGIVDYVVPEQNLINKGNTISLALDGSTGSTFYQFHDFLSGQNIWLLEPNSEYIAELDSIIAMFLVTTIRIGAENFTYNLSLTKTRLSKLQIYLPLNNDWTVDIEYIRDRMSNLRNVDLLNKIAKVRY